LLAGERLLHAFGIGLPVWQAALALCCDERRAVSSTQ